MSDKPKRNSERPKRELSDLEAAAKDVSYEIEMLFYSAGRLGARHASPQTTLSDNEKNAALECFLLHFRNLRAFLCPSLQPFSDDDIIASDLLGELKARDVGDAAILSKHKKRLNKMLAHLTYSRKGYIDRKDDVWETAQMDLALLGQFEVFLAELPTDMRAWFPAEDRISRHKVWARDLSETAEALHQTTTSVISISRL